jgi:hypothetical protein
MHTLFLAILTAILVTLLIKVVLVHQEGAECPGIVSPCILPDMLDLLTKQITHQQTLIEEYTAEIADIEKRYPISFKIKVVEKVEGKDKIVSGKLPYPSLAVTFPSPPKGAVGPRGPQGGAGVPKQTGEAGVRGPPGYYGVAK